MDTKFGGEGAKKPDSAFCPKALAEGIAVEMEHTTDKEMAKKIAKDHLNEDPLYYKKLRLVEGEPLEKARTKDEKFDSCVKQVEAKQGKKYNAYAVCRTALKKSILKKAKKSDKFESCVLQVKEKNPDWEKKGPNPWAVCHAALNKNEDQDELKKSLGWSEDDLRSMVREAKIEQLAKSTEVIAARQKLRAKIGRLSTGEHENKSITLDFPAGLIIVHFTHKAIDMNNSSMDGVLHRDIKPEDWDEGLTENPDQLRQYLVSNRLDHDILGRGNHKLSLHIPRGA